MMRPLVVLPLLTLSLSSVCSDRDRYWADRSAEKDANYARMQHTWESSQLHAAQSSARNQELAQQTMHEKQQAAQKVTNSGQKIRELEAIK